MHFEILVEDQSGQAALEILVPQVIGPLPSHRIIAYGGLGRLPKNLKNPLEARRQGLLTQLPRLLRGYGRSFQNSPDDCPAVEEGEAWLLSDPAAVKKAYPRAKNKELNAYQPDSICGPWEKLADAVYPGGSLALKAKGWTAVGQEKSEWAGRITPHIDIQNHTSPSFLYFRQTLRTLAEKYQPSNHGS